MKKTTKVTKDTKEGVSDLRFEISDLGSFFVSFVLLVPTEN
jgi:hypothetical protein